MSYVMQSSFGLPDLPAAKPVGATCSRCGRPLTDPVSAAAGIGPICASIAAAEAAAAESEGRDLVLFDPAFRSEIVFGLDDKRFATNVPMLIEGKSRNYGCGYAGSGPSALGLNIAENILKIEGFEGPRFVPFQADRFADQSCFYAAWALMHPVKDAFIVSASTSEMNRLPYDLVRNWIFAWLAIPENSGFVDSLVGW